MNDSVKRKTSDEAFILLLAISIASIYYLRSTNAHLKYFKSGDNKTLYKVLLVDLSLLVDSYDLKSVEIAEKYIRFCQSGYLTPVLKSLLVYIYLYIGRFLLVISSGKPPIDFKFISYL